MCPVIGVRMLLAFEETSAAGVPSAGLLKADGYVVLVMASGVKTDSHGSPRSAATCATSSA